MRQWRRYVLLALPALLAACALGEPEEPGCHADAECGDGLVCRAGACFRIIGDPSSDNTDAGANDGS